MGRACIVGATHNISESLSSHKSAWARMWHAQLVQKKVYGVIDLLTGKVDDLSGYDAVFVDQGMEFAGSLNLFGGANDVSWAKRLMTIKGQIWSLDQDLADYGALGKSRLSACSDEWRDFDWDGLSQHLKERTKTIKQSDFGSRKLCFGDSHSFSALPDPSYMACRNDGLTLFGAQKRGFESYIEPYGELDALTVYLGNIDIRHHLCRQADPLQAAHDLVGLYEQALKKLNVPSVELVAPLPIEDESRVLPKTGWYKGTPFYGERTLRDAVRVEFTRALEEMCNRNNYLLYLWPNDWYRMSPTNFMGEMEKPRSVHLAYKNYRWVEKDGGLESFFL